MSNPLRNPNIDYERGWFSVAVQATRCKSVFGSIVGSIRPGGSLETLLNSIRGNEKS